ncbi:structure-specific recognition protein 1 [Nematocida sp. AWRm80]|nr:structure-specific recognition protein 1 [Nematocida sp. AWRm80]
MEVLTLENVYYYYKNMPTKAVIKMAESGVGIKRTNTQEIMTIKAEEIQEMIEHYGVLSHVVKIIKKDKSIVILDGITGDALENIRQYVKKHYKLNVYNRSLAVDGNSHGKIEVLDAFVEMKVGEKSIFEIPISAISNAYERRGEGIIDIVEEYYGVSEIRFGSLKEESNVLSLVDQIKEATATGGHIEVLSVDEISCVLPRGKSKLTFTSVSMYMIGKTYSHQILYGSISKVFYLERSPEEGTEEMYHLILELSTPIRQGQTRYHYVNLLLPEVPVTIYLGNNSYIQYEEDEEEKIPEQTEEEKEKLQELGLNPLYKDTLSSSLVTILQTLSHVTPIRTGAFVSMGGSKALKCSSKANEGYLYPLKKGILFIPKIVYIEYESIEAVEFSRVNLSSRTAKTFDVCIILKDKKEHMFNGIQKTEFNAFETYLTQKNIRCRSEMAGEPWETTKDQEDEESEEEETASDTTSGSYSNDSTAHSDQTN